MREEAEGLKGNALGERSPLQSEKGLGERVKVAHPAIPQASHGSDLKGGADSRGHGDRRQQPGSALLSE